MNPYQTIQAIPTEYNGILCRSQLEAMWYAMYDLLLLEAAYEPYPLGYYIPDFLLIKQNILVEIKPEHTLAGCADHLLRMRTAGCIGTAIVHGVGPLTAPGIQHLFLGVISWPNANGGYFTDFATLTRCRTCKGHEIQPFRSAGHYNSSCSCSAGAEVVRPDEVHALFAKAKNTARWRPR